MYRNDMLQVLKGVGTEYESLRPCLDALMKAHIEDIKLAASLEKRIATLMERHATHVRAYLIRTNVVILNSLKG